ncbi:hypothetical protein Aab01nite_13160 [Paractinoplanes abujensis]|uniref:Uncharacterized protein n=1 Tax=Paractinoplanes abujensis TaxID=882441 RepID=A0A7W7CQ68_9ACTN|nr:hypothetical protein [Actinoplanes abujensis]MBB4690861.1 hypothetical protein [Actinoplanes abujensis]GID17726.1 hypothetical protein Aab01nite_13160 [Actinoplanes abujensis]
MNGTRVWIGGSPCAGKSTVAALVAESVGWPLYSCDDAFDRHAAVAGPAMRKVTTMPIGERLAQPVDVQVEDVVRACREQFPLILADLPPAAVVEGAALLPSLLAGLPVPPADAVWLVPTPAFQRHHYARRRWARDLTRGLPPSAFDRWMERDERFAARVAAEARDRGYRVLTVDGSFDVQTTAEWVVDSDE